MQHTLFPPKSALAPRIGVYILSSEADFLLKVEVSYFYSCSTLFMHCITLYFAICENCLHLTSNNVKDGKHQDFERMIYRV